MVAVLSDYERKGFFVHESLIAIKEHFKLKKYNFFMYKGKVLNSDRVTDFRELKEYSFACHLGKEMSKEDIICFLLANVIDTRDVWIGDLLSEYSKSVYEKWKGRQESLTYNFKKDLKILFEEIKAFNCYFKPQGKEFPRIIQLYFQNIITIETIVILEHILKFMKPLKIHYGNDFIFENVYYTVKGYEEFFLRYNNFDEERIKVFRKMVKENVESHTNILPF